MPYGGTAQSQLVDNGGQQKGNLFADDNSLASKMKNKLRPVRDSKQMLANDVNLLQTNPSALGLSDAEKKQMVSEASEASNTQRQAQSSELSRDALAAPDAQKGTFIEAQRAVAEGVGADAATAAVEANKLSSGLIQQEKARIMGDLDAARERARQNAQFWAQFGLDSAEVAGDFVGNALGFGGGGE